MLRYSALFVILACTGDEPYEKSEDAATTTESTASEADTATVTEEPQALVLQSEFASEENFQVEVDDIFAIWWDPAFDHSGDLATMFTWLKEIRQDCRTNLNMQDPPNPAAGVYYNVYIHHGEADAFPNEWGNGQGTDSYGMPFLTLPDGAHMDHGNVLHEGFHIFQYSANSPGFAYAGDSQWYIESAAQWYQATILPDDELSFVEAGAIASNPQLALWHSFSNQAPGDPTDWLYQVRQYGMHTYLFYLDTVAGIDSEIISGGFYAETELLPQAYHYSMLGGDELRGYFADWAAHNTGGFDYLREAQVERAWLEVDMVADPENLHPYVLELTDAEAEGEFRPTDGLAPRGWGYNVIKINNPQASAYTFVLTGDETGSEGADAHFEGRIVVMGDNGPRYGELSMSGPRVGMGDMQVQANDRAIYVVVAAVPEHFTGNQNYGYKVQIIRD